MSTEARHNIEDIFPLSPVQQGMLFHTLFEPNTGMYFDQLICRVRFIKGLDPDRFERAWHQVVERHGVLRTVFSWEKRAQPVQVVLRRGMLPITQEDWRKLDETEQDQRLKTFLETDRRSGFDLSHPPLIRLNLFQLSDEVYQFVLSYHHILMDGWSLSLVLNESLLIYEGLVAGDAIDIEPSRSYHDYVRWLRAQDVDAAEKYWRRVLSGFTAPTPPGLDRTTQPDGREGHREQYLWLSSESTAALTAFVRKYQLTASIVVQAAWALLLNRYSREEDIVYGLTFSGRPPQIAGIETMVGLFINTLPVRTSIDPQQPVLQWLKRLQAEQTALAQFELSSLAQVQAWSDAPRGVALFESVVVFQNQPKSSRRPYKFIEVLSNQYVSRMNYALSIIVTPDEKLELKISYDARRFDDDSAHRILQHLKTLLESIVADANIRIAEVPLLSQAERLIMLCNWNATSGDYPARSCIHELVEAQVTRDPQAVAVRVKDQTFSYGELNRCANRLARRLRAYGVGPEVLVGICAERSFEMIVGMLAILKAGGVHVPLDPKYPKQRLAFMLEDANPPVLLVQDKLREVLPGCMAQLVSLDDVLEETAPEDNVNVPSGAQPDNGSYVIFTSGSTGRPKGILLTHRGLCNLLPAWNELFAVDKESHVLQFASFSFDASMWEVFSALTAGARLCFGSRQTLYSEQELRQMLEQLEITHALLPPSLLNALDAGGLPLLKMVSAIGEKCTAEIAARWSIRRRFFNAYGPAEATITVSVYEASADGDSAAPPPIGKPLTNMRMYVTDRWLNPLPIGVAGELCVGGIGLARGYLNSAALTAEKFVPDPFSGDTGGRLYRTGDLARYLPSGDVEFLGRIDHQVKIRGFRIELGEIEAAVRQQAGVRDALVLVHEGAAGDKQLICYVVKNETPLDLGKLREQLKQLLPSYMIPAMMIELEQMPLTPNGKIDRAALPKPGEVQEERGEYVAPSTPVEAALVEIWKRTLGIERVGVHDNFFELGGDSILSIRVIARAKQAGLHVPANLIFLHPTIAELAANLPQTPDAPKASAPLVGPAPLLPAQLWFFEQRLAQPDHYNQALLLVPRRRLNRDQLEQSIRAIIEHHDALRARFVSSNGSWQQLIEPPESVTLRVQTFDLSAIAADLQPAALRVEAERWQRSLNLEQGPLFRAVLFELGDAAGQRLLLIAHHLVIDGVSWRILLDDLQRTYRQGEQNKPIELGNRTLSVREWAELLTARANSPELQQELTYWQAIDAPPSGDREQELAGVVQKQRARLNREETEHLLRHTAAGGKSRVEEVLLAALVHVLGRSSGAKRVIIDMEGHGRQATAGDVSRTIGWFTSLYPLCVKVSAEAKPEDVLNTVKSELRAVPAGGTGYGLLRYLTDSNLHGERNVSFNYLGQMEEFGPEELFTWAPEDAGELRSREAKRKYELEFDAVVAQGALELVWSYSKSECKVLPEQYLESLKEMIAESEKAPSLASDFPEAKLSQAKLESALSEMELG
jgi:amino acid adenylation domain-containing protein/non-ribosomal peptide synthase protein (TIGR01720 family)